MHLLPRIGLLSGAAWAQTAHAAVRPHSAAERYELFKKNLTERAE